MFVEFDKRKNIVAPLKISSFSVIEKSCSSWDLSPGPPVLHTETLSNCITEALSSAACWNLYIDLFSHGKLSIPFTLREIFLNLRNHEDVLHCSYGRKYSNFRPF